MIFKLSAKDLGSFYCRGFFFVYMFLKDILNLFTYSKLPHLFLKTFFFYHYKLLEHQAKIKQLLVWIKEKKDVSSEDVSVCILF